MQLLRFIVIISLLVHFGCCHRLWSLMTPTAEFSGNKYNVIPLISYPIIELKVGDPGTRVKFDLKWDIGSRTLLISSLVGAYLLQKSLTLSESYNSEVITIGDYILRVPIIITDPTHSISACDARDCIKAIRSKTIRPTGWFDMNDANSMWRNWHAWSLSADRLVLGTHRPIESRRTGLREILLRNASSTLLTATLTMKYLDIEAINKSNNDTALLITDSLLRANATISSHGTTLYVRLDFDLNCDFTYLPSAVYDYLMAGKSPSHIATCINSPDSQTKRVCFTFENIIGIASTNDEIMSMFKIHRFSDNDIVFGRDQTKYFMLGRDMIRDELSVAPMFSLQPSFNEIDYLLFFIIILPMIAIWYLAIYPGACRVARENVVLPLVDVTIAEKYRLENADASLFSVYDTNLTAVFVWLTRLIVVLVSVAAVGGFRLDENINPDISLQYTRLIVWNAIALAIASVSWSPGRYTPSEISLLVYHMANALFICTWLLSAIHPKRFVNQLSMTLSSGLLAIRAGEMLLFSCFATARGADAVLWRMRWLWRLYFILLSLSAYWLFLGFTMPTVLDSWWSMSDYKIELIIVVSVVICLYMPIYLVLSEMLSKAENIINIVTLVLRNRLSKEAAAAAAASTISSSPTASNPLSLSSATTAAAAAAAAAAASQIPVVFNF